MIPLTLNNKEYLLVVVPDMRLVFDTFYNQFLVMDNNDRGLESKKRKIGRGDTKGFIRFPFACEILSLLKDLTEEQAASMVGDWVNSTMWTAKEHFSSFLRSHGVDDTRNYLILAKI